MSQTATWAVPSAPSGLAMRNTVNTMVDVLRSSSSGASAPSPTVAGMFWFDESVSPAVLRIRNSSNTAWIRIIDTADATASRTALGIGTMAVVTRGATQSIPNVTDTAIAWDTVQINDGTIYSGGSPTRLTVPAGATRVRVTFSAFWGGSNTGTRNLKIRVNNTSDIVYDIRASQNETGAVVSRVYLVTAGNYFEAFVSHNAGAALTIGGNNATAFSMEVLH